jgi:multicomponent Na+:H+ antiporter subunit E
MNGAGATPSPALARSAAARAFGFLIIWIILSDAGPGDLLPGLVAAVAATWTSLRLVPPGGSRAQPLALAGLVLRYLRQSVIAGTDAARRALDPRLPLRPGFVRYSVSLRPGAARNAFTTLTSLMPGTLPIASDERSAILIHCLDVGQPIAAQLAAEEALLLRVIGAPRANG